MGSHMFLELHSKNCVFLAEEYLFSLLIFGRSACKRGLGGCTGQHAESRGIVKYYEILTYAFANIIIWIKRYMTYFARTVLLYTSMMYARFLFSLDVHLSTCVYEKELIVPT